MNAHLKIKILEKIAAIMIANNPYAQSCKQLSEIVTDEEAIAQTENYLPLLNF